MVRSGRGRALQFGILGAAAVALLGLLLWRGQAETTPAATPVVRVIEAPAPQVLPVQDLAKSDGLTSERAPLATAKGAALPWESGPAEPAQASTAPTDESDDSHPGSRVDEATLVRLHGNNPLTREHPNVAAAIGIQERNTNWLMAHPAVVGTGVGLNDEGQIALIVYAKAKAPEIPAVIDGLPVVVWQSGVIFAHNRVAAQDAATPRAKPSAGRPSGPDPKSRFERPVPIGVSTGNPNTPGWITAGTLGARVTDGTDVYALSNNHVYAKENTASFGEKVIQPGTLDGGVNPYTAGNDVDVIGTLFAHVPIVFTTTANNTVDAAIALSSTGNLSTATPSNGYGTPKSTPVGPALNKAVKKYGRTTAQTLGKIAAVNVTVTVNYGEAGSARFVSQFGVTPGKFSKGGDSGSLIVRNEATSADHHKPVGLLFAGSPTITFANDIGLVLSSFGLTFTIDDRQP